MAQIISTFCIGGIQAFKSKENGMKGQRGKQTSITRKQQRELKYRTQHSFLFHVFDLNTGKYLGEISMLAFDSEEAFVNAEASAMFQFGLDKELHVQEICTKEICVDCWPGCGGECGK